MSIVKSRKCRWPVVNRAGGIFLALAGGLLLAVMSRPVAAHGTQSHDLDSGEHKRYVRTLADYRIPDVTLTDMSGQRQSLRDLLDADDGPVMMEFVFTTCSTICPVLSATFSAVQEDLDAAGSRYRMISISIDPDHDTPDRLRGYAGRFDAGEHWTFVTGKRQDILRVQSAFDAVYPGNNKMYHRPYTYLRAAPGRRWVRLDGLLSAADLLAEYHRLSGTDGSGM